MIEPEGLRSTIIWSVFTQITRKFPCYIILSMNKVILIFSLLFCLPTFAAELCQPNQDSASPKGSVDAFAVKMSLAVGQVSDDPEVSVQVAINYFSTIQDSVDFSEKEANRLISSVKPICENNNLESKFRSRACSVVSGLHGKLAQKLQMGGISDGKSSYQYLQKSLALDPENEEAITGHAFVIIGLSDQGYIVRKLAERSLNTKIKDEAVKAKGNLERINKTNSPLYKQILDII